MNRYKDRLLEIAKLEDGWFDGTGKVPSKSGLDWLTELLSTYPEDLPKFYTYPVPDGTIQLEWSIDKHALELVVNVDTHKADFFVFSPGSVNDSENIVDLNTDWNAVLTIIRSI